MTSNVIPLYHFTMSTTVLESAAFSKTSSMSFAHRFMSGPNPASLLGWKHGNVALRRNFHLDPLAHRMLSGGLKIIRKSGRIVQTVPFVMISLASSASDTSTLGSRPSLNTQTCPYMLAHAFSHASSPNLRNSLMFPLIHDDAGTWGRCLTRRAGRVYHAMIAATASATHVNQIILATASSPGRNFRDSRHVPLGAWVQGGPLRSLDHHSESGGCS